MTKLVLNFAMSLDGFVAGPDVGVGQPMGRGGERLHRWLFDPASGTNVNGRMAREMSARVGAVVLGRRTFDVGLGPWEDTPYPAPCFVLTHERRDPLAMASGTFTFVADGIESALRQARAAAGGKDVVVMGADVARQYLKAGLVDEMVIQIAPLLLGAGTPLFERGGGRPDELLAAEVVEAPLVTHLRFRFAGRD